MLLDFFGGEPYEKVLSETMGGPKLLVVPAKFPTFERFAANLGVSYQTLRNWADVDKDGGPIHPEFFEAYARARDLQNASLIEGAMVGAFEPRVATLALKNIVRWSEKTEVTVEDTRGLSDAEKEEMTAMYANARDQAERQRAAMKGRSKELDAD